MRKLVLLLLLISASYISAQDELPAKPKLDRLSSIQIKENVFVCKSSVQYSSRGTYYTEIYDVITDSVVNRFAMQFRSVDSSFVRKYPVDKVNRKVYDMMHRTTSEIIDVQEQRRLKTIDFLNSYSMSVDVWVLFKLYGVLK